MILTTFLWIATFLAYFACALITLTVARLISFQITVLMTITGWVAGFVSVCVGGFVAPSHKTVAVIVLAAFNGLWSLSNGKRVAFVRGVRVDWLYVACALGGMVAAFNF